MTYKSIVMIALAWLIPSVAFGEGRTDDCPCFYLSGLFYHAADLCNHSWLDRDGLRIVSACAAQCKITPKKAKILLKKGFNDFDSGITNRGWAAVCAFIDTEMTITENGK